MDRAKPLKKVKAPSSQIEFTPSNSKIGNYEKASNNDMTTIRRSQPINYNNENNRFTSQ